MTSESFCSNTQLLELLPLLSKTVLSVSDLRKAGCTKSQMLILNALSRRGNLTMGKVASFLSSSKEQATRAVAPLVESGIVERYTDPENRTRIHIQLTETGKALMEQNNKNFVHNLYQHLKERITDEEMLELNAAVDAMVRILTKVEDT